MRTVVAGLGPPLSPIGLISVPVQRLFLNPLEPLQRIHSSQSNSVMLIQEHPVSLVYVSASYLSHTRLVSYPLPLAGLYTELC